MIDADAGAEELEPAAGARALDYGVLLSVVLPNSSATTVAKGKTVDEPTILI